MVKNYFKHRAVALCFFALLIFQHGKAQKPQEIIDKHIAQAGSFLYTKMDSALLYLNEAATLARTHKKWESYASIMVYRVNCAGYHFQMDSLYAYLTNAEKDIRQIRYDTTDYSSDTKLFLLNGWGNYYYKTGNFQRALEKFDSINIFLENKTKLTEYDYQTLIVNYLYLGNINSLKGNYQTAISHFQYCFKYAEALKKNLDIDYNSNYIYEYIASTYKKKGNYKQAFFYYKKVNNHYKKGTQSNAKGKNSLLNNYNNIATLYLEQNKPDSTLLYLNESLQYHLSDDPFYSTTWLNIGKAHSQKGEYAEAEEYMNKSLTATQDRYGNKHYKTAEVHLEIGNIFQEKQDFEAALAHYQESVVSLVDEYNDTSIYSLPIDQNVNNKKELLLALQSKANAFHALYLKNKNLENLNHANTHIQLTIRVMDDIRREYSSEEARQFLVEKSYPIFEKAIEINRQLYLQTNDESHLAEAFRVAEKSKSLSLLDALKNADARQFADIPEHILEQERQLRVQINHLKGKISRLKKESKNENTLRQLQNELFEQEQLYDNFVLQLENQHPDYYRLKYAPHIATLDDVRRDMLPRDAVFVEYFMGDEQLYTFFISKNNIHLSAIPNTEHIQTNAATLRQAITKKTDTAYIRSAYFLYQNLIEEGLEKMGGNIARIIVVPDGALAYIPFDILLKNEVKYKKNQSYRNDIMPYLINDYAVSYAYSATVLQQNLNVKKDDNIEHDFAGFAPKFIHTNDTEMALRSCHDNRLISLPHSQYEVDSIQKLIGGKIFTETDASIANFIQIAANSRLIHLSTHACANEDDQLSRIYFNDEEYLTALELYALRLRADMVVLSACETGIGKLQRGEGVMSLARAFAYTGIPATTMSLWSVDDRATSQIMVHYYKHLKSGQTKDEALRNAKLYFLKHDVEENRHQHPYYWAAFVHIGNADALAQGPNWWFGLLALALLIGIVGIRQFYHKNKTF